MIVYSRPFSVEYVYTSWNMFDTTHKPNPPVTLIVCAQGIYANSSPCVMHITYIQKSASQIRIKLKLKKVKRILENVKRTTVSLKKFAFIHIFFSNSLDSFRGRKN